LKVKLRFGTIAAMLSLGSMALAQSVSCPGAHCPVTFEGFNPAMHLIDCGSYSEVLTVKPITGSVILSNYYEIDRATIRNCSSTDVTQGYTLNGTETESESHSKSGELKSEVAVKVGAKDVGELGLTHASIQGNGWQYAASYSQSISSTSSMTVGPCKGKKIVWRGKKKNGNHSGSGYYDYTCNAYVAPFGIVVGNPFTVAGRCMETTSDAIGSKQWFSIDTLVSDIDPGCDPNDPCKKKCK